MFIVSTWRLEALPILILHAACRSEMSYYDTTQNYTTWKHGVPCGFFFAGSRFKISYRTCWQNTILYFHETSGKLRNNEMDDMNTHWNEVLLRNTTTHV